MFLPSKQRLIGVLRVITEGIALHKHEFKVETRPCIDILSKKRNLCTLKGLYLEEKHEVQIRSKGLEKLF